MGLLKARLANRLLRLRRGRGSLSPLAAANLRALDHLDPRAPAASYSFAVLDLETTGMDINSDRVVSVGAVRLAQGRVRLGDHFSELINPGLGIPSSAVKIHGIKPDQVKAARPAGEVFQDFLAWLGGDILVAHAADFDLFFINRTMRGLYGFALQNLVLDTVRMCQGVLLKSDPYGIGRHTQRCTLDALSRRFNIDSAARHTALGDALATALIFQRLLARLEQRGGGSLGALIRVAALE